MNEAILKIITHTVNDSIKLLERINYIRNPLASNPSVTYCAYVSAMYPYEEMMMTKFCYQSTTNNTLSGNNFFEFVVSLSEDDSEKYKEFLLCAQEIVTFLANFGGYFQTIGCVHTNTDNLHIHIIVNNTDFMTGGRLQIPYKAFYEIRCGVSDILIGHGFSGICNQR
ncbi:MAG: relaxase/mobilization nuclease domain-containing protein [Selenomonadaceae bacterium]|nr:relaxase/mobilization nuclease domain-containing protein [Selenomonadaceae bacterium]